MTEALALFAVTLLWLPPVIGGLVAVANAFQVSGLKARIARLEARLAAGTPPAPPAPEPRESTEEVAVPTEETPGLEVELPPPEPVPAPPAPPPPPPLPPPLPKPPRPPPFAISPERLVVWFAAGAGALLVLLAGLFALAVAIQAGLLGPGIRVAGALFLGSAGLVAGTVLRRRFPVVAAGLSGAGLAISFATLYAAHSLYGLLSGGSAFGWMVATCAVATAAAVRHRDRLLAWLALVGGFLTPILVSSGENKPLGLFAYLGVLSVGQLAAAWRRGWADTALGTLLGTLVLYAGWTASWHAADQVPLALIGAFGLALPWAVVAASKPAKTGALEPLSDQRLVRAVGAVGAAVWPLLALPWVVPVDPMFYDPRSGISVVRPLGGALRLCIAAVALLPLPGWLAARRHSEPVAALATSIAGGVLALSLAAGWGSTEGAAVGPLVLAVVLPALVGGAVFFRDDARIGLFPLPLAAGLGLAGLAMVEGADGSALSAGVVAVVAFGLAAGDAPVLAMAAVLGVGCALGALGGVAGALGPTPILGAGLFALGALGTFPLVRRPAAPGTSWTQRVAALTGVVLFPGLYLAWRAEFGPTHMGPLPLVVGVIALLGAAIALRAHRADAKDLGLTVLIGVALFGAAGAVPAQLENGWLTVAWSIEAAALAALYARFRHPLVPIVSVGLSVLVAVRLLFNPWALSYGTTGGWFLLNWPLYTWGVPFLALLATSALLRRNGRDGPVAAAAVPVLMLGLLVGFALVNVEVSDAFQDSGPLELGGASVYQGMVRSLAWAAYGLAVLVAGLARDSRFVRFVGFAFVFAATIKVCIYDLWALHGFVRVGSVFGLGVALLVAALLFEWLVIRGGRVRPAKTEEVAS